MCLGNRHISPFCLAKARSTHSPVTCHLASDLPSPPTSRLNLVPPQRRSNPLPAPAPYTPVYSSPRPALPPAPPARPPPAPPHCGLVSLSECWQHYKDAPHWVSLRRCRRQSGSRPQGCRPIRSHGATRRSRRALGPTAPRSGRRRPSWGCSGSTPPSR